MARLPFVEPSAESNLKELVDRIRAQKGGQITKLYAVLLHNPAICAGWLELLTAVRLYTKIPAVHREMALVRVGLLNDAQHEVKSHAKLALEEGVTQEQLDALPNWRASKLFDTSTRAVLAYAEAMTRDIKVSDEVFEGVRAIYDDRQVMEITAVIAAYNLVSRFLVALQI